MNTKGLKVILGAMAVALVACAVGAWFLSGNLRKNEKEVQVLNRDLEALRDSLATSRKHLQGGNGEPSYDIEMLQEQGLPDPIHQLRTDLMGHPEIIPFKGVLGGTMGFYSPEDIHILSTSWVFARFEDGHIGGSCLLEYEIKPDTTIRWHLIKAKLEDY